MKAERLLTQVAVNDVVVGCREVFEHTGKSRSQPKLAQSGIDPSAVGLEDIFNETSDPFAGLETPYLQENFISQELGFVAC